MYAIGNGYQRHAHLSYVDWPVRWYTVGVVIDLKITHNPTKNIIPWPDEKNRDPILLI